MAALTANAPLTMRIVDNQRIDEGCGNESQHLLLTADGSTACHSCHVPAASQELLLCTWSSAQRVSRGQDRLSLKPPLLKPKFCRLFSKHVQSIGQRISRRSKRSATDISIKYRDSYPQHHLSVDMEYLGQQATVAGSRILHRK